MRSRSSRLFVVLVHLVGISNNLPGSNLFYSSYFSGSSNSNGFGIVGVHPMTILLESLELDAAGGLDQLLKSLDSAGYDVDLAVLGEPYWLQDDNDGKCLGPTGFSECGDATLWLLRRRSSNKKNNKSTTASTKQSDSKGSQKRRSVGDILSRFLKGESNSQEDDVSSGYALQLIDVHSLHRQKDLSNKSEENTQLNEIQDTSKQRKRPWRRRANISKATAEAKTNNDDETECLLVYNTENSGIGPYGSSSLSIGPCSSEEAWLWNIDGNGVLVWDENITSSKKKRKTKKNRKRFVGSKTTNTSARRDNSPMCLRRINQTIAEIGSCSDDRSVHADNGNINQKLIGFSLVQYQTTSALSPKLPRHPKVTSNNPSLPQMDASHFSPSTPSLHTKSKDNEWSAPVAGNLMKQRTGSSMSSERISEDKVQICSSSQLGYCDDKEHIPRSVRTSQSHAVSAPMLHPELKPASQYFPTKNIKSMNRGSVITSQDFQKKTASFDELEDRSSPSLVSGMASINKERMLPKKSTKNLLHHPHSVDVIGSQDSVDDTPHRTRKIPVHPYIEASKGSGTWKDPQTDLNYLTDISEYLGLDRKKMGRHTLMGVGQYTRTMLKIKVYGISFYVAKRDVLADPEFKRYAHLSSEDLRKRTDFYNHLMQSPISNGSNGEAPCVVDRTLILQLNMQLSTETLRSSLDADWSLLSPEHRQGLIDASFEDRPANEKMLKKITSDENPSNCSCGQVAPDDYNVDRTCCARGTELGFTWKKSGNFEVRLDGRLVKTFEDPAIGKAIFYEYFREDNPMSVEARNNFVDGFPFLLAPLAQLRDMKSPVKQPHVLDGMNRKSHGTEGKSENFINSLGESLGNQAGEFFDWVNDNARGGISNVAKATNFVVDEANNIGEEIDKRRIMLWKQLLSIPEQSINIFSMLPTNKRKKDLDLVRFVASPDSDIVSKNRSLNGSTQSVDISQQSTIPISDEIGVIIHPTVNFTHALFGTMVHLYLMLLLIVSVPGSSSTKMIVKRQNNNTSDSETDSCTSNDCSKQNNDSDSDERRDPYENSLMSSDLAGIEVSLDVHRRTNISLRPSLEFRNREMPEASEDEDCQPTNNSKLNTQKNMKKALSYCL